ncbi:MAG: response regulator transcription factor [Desulfobacterales bacterium]|nr:response regulator transcription factor [Desulfobacterales bacterium]
MADILIVDDNTIFRKMLKRILLSRFPSMHIREAQDANSAFKKTEKQVPDLIFIDLRLPDENGFQLTRKIKTAYPEIIIIMITSCDFPEYREAAFEAGADFFVSKNTSTTEDVMESVESIFSPN